MFKGCRKLENYFDKEMFYDRSNNYGLSSIATIKLWLRRTLLLFQYYSAFLRLLRLAVTNQKIDVSLSASLAMTKNLRCWKQSQL